MTAAAAAAGVARVPDSDRDNASVLQVELTRRTISNQGVFNSRVGYSLWGHTLGCIPEHDQNNPVWHPLTPYYVHY